MADGSIFKWKVNNRWTICPRISKYDAIIIHYDSDEISEFFGEKFGFNETNRGREVEVLEDLAWKANDAGVNVIISA